MSRKWATSFIRNSLAYVILTNCDSTPPRCLLVVLWAKHTMRARSQTMCWCLGWDTGWQGVHGCRRSSRPSRRPRRACGCSSTRVQNPSQADQSTEHWWATYPYRYVSLYDTIMHICRPDDVKRRVRLSVVVRNCDYFTNESYWSVVLLIRIYESMSTSLFPYSQ